jgi:hypothetical protein
LELLEVYFGMVCAMEAQDTGELGGRLQNRGAASAFIGTQKIVKTYEFLVKNFLKNNGVL